MFLTALLQSITYTTPPPIYSADFSSPLDLQFEADLLDAAGTHRVRVPSAGWVLESQSNGSTAYTADGNLVMENRGSHMVLWVNRPVVRLNQRNCSRFLGLIFFSTPLLSSLQRVRSDLA